MAQQYVFVRMPKKTYEEYRRLQYNMESDLKKFAGKPIKIPMTKVMHMVASPTFNENFIQLDLKKVKEFAKKYQW